MQRQRALRRNSLFERKHCQWRSVACRARVSRDLPRPC